MSQINMTMVHSSQNVILCQKTMNNLTSECVFNGIQIVIWLFDSCYC